MDIFEEYITKHKRDENCRALTCKSYRKVYQNKHQKKLDEDRINTQLATYGDALLKFALCSILLDKAEKLSESKKEYETDEYLIIYVAKHYKLLDYMNFDRDDDEVLQDYIFDNDKKTKYIATTVEAVLGAIFQENNDFESIRILVESWMILKDKEQN